MKIVKEDPYLFVLNDYNLSYYFGAIISIVVGFIVAYAFFFNKYLP